MVRKVAVIMGSDSDWPVVKGACAQLKALDIPFEAHILSAHRTPAEAAAFAKSAKANGFGVILCAAGMAAHLAGAFAANTTLPVIGIPMKGGAMDGLDALLATVQMPSGIPSGIGFIKNKYIGRTFIQGSQKQRENSVRIKLNVVSSTVKGKRVVLVDDSIVRGTTSARIIKLLRDAGAAEVHFMVSAPPFKYPCYFGTDIPDQKLLVATGRTLEQINEVIGADTLGYLSNEHVVQLAKNAKCGFCTACFTGEYAVEPESVLSTDIHDRHLNDRPKDAKKLGE